MRAPARQLVGACTVTCSGCGAGFGPPILYERVRATLGMNGWAAAVAQLPGGAVADLCPDCHVVEVADDGSRRLLARPGVLPRLAAAGARL